MKEFIWNESLVEELLLSMTSMEDPIRVQCAIERFKASKHPKPEWEILTGITFGSVHDWIEKGDASSANPRLRNSCHENGCKIHSVKRLSDGEVFTVGDEVFSGGNKIVIAGFEIIGSDIFAQSAGCIPINIKRLMKEEKIPPAANGKLPVWLTPAEKEKLKKFLDTL